MDWRDLEPSVFRVWPLEGALHVERLLVSVVASVVGAFGQGRARLAGAGDRRGPPQGLGRMRAARSRSPSCRKRC